MWKDETRVGWKSLDSVQEGSPPGFLNRGVTGQIYDRNQLFLPKLRAFSLCLCSIRYHCFKGLEQVMFH